MSWPLPERINASVSPYSNLFQPKISDNHRFRHNGLLVLIYAFEKCFPHSTTECRKGDKSEEREIMIVYGNAEFARLDARVLLHIQYWTCVLIFWVLGNRFSTKFVLYESTILFLWPNLWRCKRCNDDPKRREPKIYIRPALAACQASKASKASQYQLPCCLEWDRSWTWDSKFQGLNFKLSSEFQSEFLEPSTHRAHNSIFHSHCYVYKSTAYITTARVRLPGPWMARPCGPPKGEHWKAPCVFFLFLISHRVSSNNSRGVKNRKW